MVKDCFSASVLGCIIAIERPHFIIVCVIAPVFVSKQSLSEIIRMITVSLFPVYLYLLRKLTNLFCHTK